MSEPASQRFRRTREDHRLEQAEDYCELVFRLGSESGSAGVSQMASSLGVSRVTVSKTLKRLARDGYVVAEPYAKVELTELGRDLALAAVGRHETVVRFLIAIGVESTVAETDAEGIEHHVSPTTLAAMRWFLDSQAK